MDDGLHNTKTRPNSLSEPNTQEIEPDEKSLKILYHHRTLGDGAEGIHIAEMIAAFRQCGHQVNVISPIGENTGVKNSQTKSLGKLKSLMPYFAFELMEMAYSLVGAFKLAKEIKRCRPDFIYERYITFNLSSVIIKRLFNIPVLLEVNAPLALERAEQPDEKLFFKRLASWMEFAICRNCTQTIVVSTPLRNYLLKNGVPEASTSVMPNGVNLETFSAPTPEYIAKQREQLDIPKNAIVIGFVGIMRSWHGIEGLIDAFCDLLNEHPNLFLLLVGDGPEQANYECILQDKGVASQSKITGRISHQDVPRYISVFDIATAPKSTFYASPMKILEYMALAKPVIASKTPNIEDLISSPHDGLLFDPEDINGMHAALQKLLSVSLDRQNIALAARKKCEDSLNWVNNARNCVKLMEPYV